ncbi:MAG: PIN domain-containing protein [Candidatus Lokiarchaeota archaeon]|nr:PIN domain-containing protein [Candidatus Lokiarchaeota archaeon]
MRKIIVDANVIVKWFIEEIYSDKARILRDKFIDGEIELLAPSLLYFEVLNALKYSQIFNKNDLNNAGVSLENYGFKIIPIKKNIRKQMIEIALDYDISIYDAAYIGLSKATGNILFTADKKIIKNLPEEFETHVKDLSKIEDAI